MAFSTRTTALIAALLLPTFAIAQEGEEAEDCDYPVKVLWHADDEKDGLHRMGVSVTNRSGQQVPNLKAETFTITHQGTEVKKDDNFKVGQSKNVLVQAATDAEGDETAAAEMAALSKDPINYDVYFAVDLTKSMGDEIGGGKSKKQVVAEVISLLTAPNKKGEYALFDQQDRVYIAGFTSKVETITEAPTAKREKLISAFGDLAQFEVRDDKAALNSAISHNLGLIKGAAAQYKDAKAPRQAVLIAITDSFNGINPGNGRGLRRCDENNALNDALRQEIIDTRKEVNEQFKMYVLGLGKFGETERYKVKEPHHRYCDIAKTQEIILDGKSLAAIGSKEITNGGGLHVSENPAELAKWLLSHFEALKTAYDITYTVPAEAADASMYKAAVTILDTTCEGILVESNEFIRQATAKSDTTASEMALFLASLLLALLFIPRTLTNLGSLGGGDGSPAPKKKKKKGGKKKKRRK
ncbi:MAG: VWA domain-containing protein [Deltaproteobacteria bacterium]|nr:VWA domain-containing protein [Deltaproteobacteria bacterium]